MLLQHVLCRYSISVIFMCLIILVIAIEVASLESQWCLNSSLYTPYGWQSHTEDFRAIKSSQDNTTHFGFYSFDQDLFQLSVIWKLPIVNNCSFNCTQESTYQRIWSAKHTRVRPPVCLHSNEINGGVYLSQNGTMLWYLQLDGTNLTNAEYILKAGELKIVSHTNQLLWSSFEYPSKELNESRLHGDHDKCGKCPRITLFSGLILLIGGIIGFFASPTYRWLKGSISVFSTLRIFLSLFRDPSPIQALSQRPLPLPLPLPLPIPPLALAPSLLQVPFSLPHLFPLPFPSPFIAPSILRILSPSPNAFSIVSPYHISSSLSMPVSLSTFHRRCTSLVVASLPLPLSSILNHPPSPLVLSTLPTLSLKRASSPLQASSSLPTLYPLLSTSIFSPLPALFSLPIKLSSISILLSPLSSSLLHAQSLLPTTTQLRFEEDVVSQHSFLRSSHRFSTRELEIATRKFTKVIGEGGFGKVYEGILSDGTKVAIKRLCGGSQGQKEFQAEIFAIGNIQHHHIARLLGYCSEGHDQMLVYELAENGSLERWLFGDLILDWATRFQIILDIANGLCHLHQNCEQKIIHFDVKPHNILLDGDFRAKITDFGMSELCQKESHIETHMRGTPGYIAPDWYHHSTVSEKCDVYSFGMVLLEIVGGRKNAKSNEVVEKWYFPSWVVTILQRKKNCQECVDIRLHNRLTTKCWNETNRVIRVALWCVQDDPHLRPSMDKVIRMLEGIVNVDDPPLSFDFLEGSRL